MSYLTVNDQYVKPFINDEQVAYFQGKVSQAHKQLHEKSGLGNDSLGWLTFPNDIDSEELEQIKYCAKKIRQNSEVLIVIGVGGSYLGAKAAIDLLSHRFYNQLPKEKRTGPEIIFVGNQFSSRYLHDVLEYIDGKEVSINVISKSGTTLEPAVAFHFFKDYLEQKYGKEASSKRIFVTTDPKHGELKKSALENGYETFDIPSNIGGRYSVLTAVGLLPIAVSGVNVDELLRGAQLAMKETRSDNIMENSSYHYALLRNILYENEKKIELLVSFEPYFNYLQEWWKQLFGESEGKNGKGIFPASATFTTDLHSIGQYIQQGERHLFQTVIFVEDPGDDIEIKPNFDKDYFVNKFAHKTLHELNKAAFQGALAAHSDGGVPNIVLQLPRVDAFTFGYLVYFFELACAISGYLLQVNPFDQPGVESYKRNMLSLLNENKHKN